jgi:hypothetical protein
VWLAIASCTFEPPIARPFEPAEAPPEAAPDAHVRQAMDAAVAPRPMNAPDAAEAPQADAADMATDAGEVDGALPTSCSMPMFSFNPDQPGPQMNPGRACNACHAVLNVQIFAVAGTLFATLHEPDDCRGDSGGMFKVIVTDNSGLDTVLEVNATGNFMSATAINGPYTARVERGTVVRKMLTAQTNGDCNACHDQVGEYGAPGRILAP